MDENTKTNSPSFEAATVYLLLEHQIILEEIKLKLRRQGIKASKSKLTRVAINLLGEQSIEKIINSLEQDKGE